jgi:hypothetical protein
MSETQRLAAAIKTISEKYLTNVVKSGDKEDILKWSLRLADYSTRLAVEASPPLASKEALVLDEPPVYSPPLTYDQETEIFLDAEDEMLAALDRPYGRDGAERGALPLFTHIEMAERLGLPLHAAEFKSFIVPGASQ